jgi:GAF domain-containing protein
MAEEQAALDRVATLVAGGAAPEEVFAAEVGLVLSADVTGISRYDPDGSAAAVGGWSSTGAAESFPVGTRVHLGGRNVVSQVLETGRPARIDNRADGSGEPAGFARARGFGSVAGGPISVEGQAAVARGARNCAARGRRAGGTAGPGGRRVDRRAGGAA